MNTLSNSGFIIWVLWSVLPLLLVFASASVKYWTRGRSCPTYEKFLVDLFWSPYWVRRTLRKEWEQGYDNQIGMLILFNGLLAGLCYLTLLVTEHFDLYTELGYITAVIFLYTLPRYVIDLYRYMKGKGKGK